MGGLRCARSAGLTPRSDMQKRQLDLHAFGPPDTEVIDKAQTPPLCRMPLCVNTPHWWGSGPLTTKSAYSRGADARRFGDLAQTASEERSAE